MFPQLDSVFSSDTPLKDKVTYLTFMNQLQGANLDEKQLKLYKETIKDMVKSPLTRLAGLEFFRLALQQYTSFYVDNWPNIVVANLSSCDKLCQEITYEILKHILKCSHCEEHKSTVLYHAPKIMHILMDSNNSKNVSALQCLSMCMKGYPRAASKFIDDILEFVIKHMDTNSPQQSEAIAECFLALPAIHVCSMSSKDVTLHGATLLFSKRLLFTLKETLNNLLRKDIGHLGEGEKFFKEQAFEIPDIPDALFSSSMMLARMFTSLSVCLAKMMCYGSLDVQFAMGVLEFIQSVFQMTQLSKKTESPELREIIVLVYPGVQKGVFTILELLIQNLPMQGQVENVMDLLRKSIEASYISTFTHHANYHMRCITWKTLNIFFNSKRFSAALEIGNRKYLIQELLKDIMPSDEETGEQRQHHMSKKSGYAFPVPDGTSPLCKIKMETCNEALSVLKSIIYHASPYLPENVKEDMGNKIFAISKATYRGCYYHKRLPFPYIHDQCRQNLYELNLAILVSSNFKRGIEMQSQAVLKKAQNDQSLKIREFLSNAIHVYRNILYPKRKSADAVPSKKTFYEVNGDSKVGYGWDTVTTWNTSDRGNPLTNTSNRSDKSVNIPNENHDTMNENDMSEDFISDKEYNSSKMDTSQNSHISDSESDGTMEHETIENETIENELIEDVETSKPSSNTVVASETPEEVTTKTVSSEEEGPYSEQEEAVVAKDESVEPEGEWNSSSCEKVINQVDREKALIQTDQNGIVNSSEEEVSSINESENEDDSESEVEEEEDAKECSTDSKREAENLSEDERPSKKQRLSEETVETQEELNENKTEEINEVDSEIKVPTVTTEQYTTQCSSPTFEEMCSDLVLHESSQLAES